MLKTWSIIKVLSWLWIVIVKRGRSISKFYNVEVSVRVEVEVSVSRGRGISMFYNVIWIKFDYWN